VSSSQHLPSAESEPAEIIRRTLKCVSYWLRPWMTQASGLWSVAMSSLVSTSVCWPGSKKTKRAP